MTQNIYRKPFSLLKAHIMHEDKPKRELITELTGFKQKVAEQERSSAERHRPVSTSKNDNYNYKIVDATPESIVVVSANGIIRSCNPATEKLIGYTTKELIGKPIQEILPIITKEKDPIKRILKNLTLEKEMDSYEIETIKKDGTQKWMSVKICFLGYERGAKDFLIISRDITERKQMVEDLKKHRNHLKQLIKIRTAELVTSNKNLKKEINKHKQYKKKIHKLNEKLEHRVRERTAELEHAYEELKKLNTIKESFLSSVSHELRTPLTSIRSFSEILLKYNDEDPETRKEFLEIIHIESERLTRLINDVLDLSRIEAGMMRYNDEFTPLDKVIKAATKSQLQLLQEKSLCLDLDISRDLPLAYVDADRIHQVITNLLGNAIKFSYEGGEIRIRAEKFDGKRSREASEWIKICVSDQGIGIDKKDFGIIFDKFRQAYTDTLKAKPKGTGLGLPICREIITHYRGNIWVESKKGEGSTFFFAIPSSIRKLKAAKESVLKPRDILGWKRKNVLIVDDNKNIRRLLRHQLQNKGYTVFEASNGTEALKKAEHEHIDLITLDLVMPMMNGYDMLDVIKKNPLTKNIPVLVVSMIENKDKGIQLGANDYLGKPFPEHELIRKVKSLLGEDKQSILVADDNPSILASLRTMLEKKNYPVYTANNGQEAIEFLSANAPDLVILDMAMPKKNGYEVLSWIRSHPEKHNLPVIILSANSLSEEGTKLLSLGKGAYIKKSEDLSSLFEKIDYLIMSSTN